MTEISGAELRATRVKQKCRKLLEAVEQANMPDHHRRQILRAYKELKKVLE